MLIKYISFPTHIQFIPYCILYPFFATYIYVTAQMARIPLHHALNNIVGCEVI